MFSNNSWLGFLGNHVIAFALFVGFPGLVTAIAPVSWVKFTRQGEKVSAVAKVCFFYVIPYRTDVIDPVVGIDDKFIAGHLPDQSHYSPNESRSRTEDQAYLLIHGKDQSSSVPVTPFNIRKVVERSKDFLDDPNSTELKLFVVANWKFSIGVAGGICLLTVLWVVSIVSSLYVGIAKLFGLGKQPDKITP